MDGGKVIIKIDGDTKPFENSMKSVDEGIGTLNTAFAAVGAAAAAGLAAATKYGMDFEAQMSTVGAISGATAGEMGQLTEKAKEMGIQSAFSATEAGQAFEYMAMAGWKSEDMLNGIEGIMNLAAASGEDLAMVSDIVTDSMTAFGLAAEESGRFADVLAAASSNSNTNVALLGESFKYVAPVAGALGYSIEDTAVALGLMANAGIKASQSGTSMRSLLTRLVKPTKQSAAAMDDLDLSITDAKGNMKPLNQLLQEMRSKFSALTDAEKAEYAALLAGQQGMSGLLAIVNASDDDFNKLTESINNSAGSAEKMAEIKLDNLQGQITLLGSSFEGLGIAVYDKFGNMAKEAVKEVIEWLNAFTEKLSNGEFDNILKGIATGIAGIGTALLALNAAVIIQDIINAFQGLEATTKLVSAAQTALNAIMAMNPYVLIATAVIAATAALATYVSLQEVEETHADIIIQQAEERRQALEDEKQAYEDLKQSQIDKASADLAEVANTQVLYDELKNLVGANGEVDEANQARVNFILGELNSAYGTEYKLIDGVIKGYQDMQTEIDNLIEKRKYEIAQKAALPLYEKAITDGINHRIKAEEDKMAVEEQAQKVTEAKMAMEEAYAKYVETRIAVYGVEYGKLKEIYEDEAAAYAELAQNKLASSAQIREDERIMQEYQKATALASQGMYTEASAALAAYTSDFHQKLSDAAGDIQKQRKTVETEFQKAQGMVQSYLDDVSIGVTEFDEGILRQLIEHAGTVASEGEKVGANLGDGIITGLDGQESSLTTKTKEMADNLVNSTKEALAVRSSSSETMSDEVGAMIPAGIAEGITENAEAVETATENLAKDIPGWAKEPLDIQSPSGIMRDEVGYMIDAGIAAGISGDKGVGLVENAVKELAGHIPDWAKELLGIHSPSAVMRDEVGAMIIAGLVEGITDNRSEVQKVMDDMNEELLDSQKWYLAEKQRIEDEAAKKSLQRKYDDAEKALREAERKANEQLEEDLKKARQAQANAETNAAEKRREAIDKADKQLTKDLEKANNSKKNKQDKIDDAYTKHTEAIANAEDEYNKSLSKKITAGTTNLTNAYDKRDKAIIDAKKKYAETIEQINQDELDKAEKKGNEEYLATLKEIADRECKINEAREKDIKAAKEKIISEYEDMVNKISDAVKEVEDAQKSLADKFKNFGDLYHEVKIDDVDVKFGALSDITEQRIALKKYSEKLAQLREKEVIPEEFYNVFKGMSTEEGIKLADEILKKNDKVLKFYIDEWQKAKDLTKDIEGSFAEAEPTFALSDLDAQTKQLQEYTDTLQALKERGLSDGLYSAIRDMSVEEGAKFMSALLAATDEEFNDYVKAWENKQISTENMAKDLYSGEVENLKETVMSELGDFSTMLSTEAEKSGEDWMKAFVEGIKTTGPDLLRGINTMFNGLVSTPSPADMGRTVNNYTTYTERAPINVTAKIGIGGREFAQAALPPLREELKRTGQGW